MILDVATRLRDFSVEAPGTAAAGCTGTESVTVAQPEALDVWITTSIYGDFNISTVNGSDGFIELEVTGGTPQYTYEWSHDSNINASNVYNLPAGDYAITIIDAHGCKKLLNMKQAVLIAACSIFISVILLFFIFTASASVRSSEQHH